MASYTVANGDHACHAKALVANTADTVAFAGAPASGGWRNVEIANHPGSSGIIYACSDGTAATVAGPRTVIVFPGQAVTIPNTDRASGSISLISSATATYSVTEV